MKNKNYIFLKISGVLGVVFGIIYCITIVGIIVGVPLIIGATKFFSLAKQTDEELQNQKDTVLVWGIVFTIIIFPLGALALIPSFNLDGQLYSSGGYKPTKAEDKSKKSKAERINELFELKEKGLIDENDFQIAKNKIINEDE